MRLHIYLAFLLSLLLGNTYAQDNGTTLTATVQNEQGQPLEHATAELRREKDSALIRTAIADAQGIIHMLAVPEGSYFMRITFIDYMPIMVLAIRVTPAEKEKALGKQVMQAVEKKGTEVVVTARKPFIQRLTDRIVVNVENSIMSAGSSALEVLERAPGVTVDQNDAIALRGRQGVIIMIDGKPTAMTGSDLANYLRGLPSSSIERIDIITNPSAKYDAAGNSGIIDIRMKKDQRLGTNGTLTAGYGQGVYPKANTGITFNHRNKKMNLYGNYNYSYRKGLNHLILDRSFYTAGGAYTGGDLKNNYTTTPLNFHNTRLGIDIFPSSRTIIGAVVSGNFGNIRRKTVNSSEVIDAQSQKSSTFNTNAWNRDRTDNAVANINFKHSFKKAGMELTADVDYGTYGSHSLSSVGTSYYDLAGGTLQPDYVLDSDQDGVLQLLTSKVDFVNPLSKGGRLEAGFKTSRVTADNDAKFFDVSSGIPQDDVNKTNHFKYKEYNNAVYFNFNREFKKLNIQLGLRGEHTRINTHQEKGNQRFDSSYFQLFPSAFLQYKLKEDESLGLSLSRRIDRPGYSQLNPFLFLIDVTTYATGRPGLLPQLTWSYEMSYTRKGINFTLGYSHTRQNQNILIARFKDVFPNIPSDDNVTVQIPTNLQSLDYYGLTVTAPLRVASWWNMLNNGNVFYTHYNGKLGGTSLNKGQPALDIRTNNTFTLGKGWTTEMSFNYTTGGRDGFMVMRSLWGLGLGVQKSLLSNQATVRFNFTDIFWTNLPRAVITYNNYVEKWHAFRETRVANLSFTYRFGKNTIQASRRRATASEEERRRAGG